MEINVGLPERFRQGATDLFWEGFGSKLRRPLGKSEAKAKEFLGLTFDPDNVLLAIEDDGVLGFMGVSDTDHPMKTDEWACARSVYGVWGAVWRLALLAPMEQKPPKDGLYLEWIAVSSSARGRGIGTQMMSQVEDVARERGLFHVALDVIDSNPRAQALYAELGYDVESTHTTGPFAWLYGFGKYTRMVKPLR